MISTFFAIKAGMTGKFDDKGNRVGITSLQVLPMSVLDSRIIEKHGYKAIRIKITDQRFKRERIKEIRTEEVLDPGKEIKMEDVLHPGDIVQVTGISKGKGFAGVVKRYHFKGGPRTHGQSNKERSPGSSGSTTTPGRVLPGTRRAGHMGNVRVSVGGLKVFGIDSEKGIVSVVGSVPGMGRGKGQLITITKQS